MELRHFNTIFFFVLLILAGSGVAFLFSPFFTAIVMAAIFAILFQRPYRFLLRLSRNRAALSAFGTCLLMAFLVVTPIFLSLSFAVSEANTLYHSLGDQTTETLVGNIFQNVERIPVIGGFFDSEAMNADIVIADIEKVGKNILGLIQTAYQGVANFLFWVFVMFFAFYYFLVDGKRAISYLMRMSPLRDDHDRLLMDKFVAMGRATIKGTILVGLIQGCLGGVIFWVAGIPSPIVWTLIMIVCSIIPVAGAGLVWVPAGIILIFLGDIWQGIFILGVGLGVISTIDNILRPKLVGGRVHMHPLLVFFSSLGGILAFGLSGFIIGPVILALFLALMEIYGLEFSRELKHFNRAKTGA